MKSADGGLQLINTHQHQGREVREVFAGDAERLCGQLTYIRQNPEMPIFGMKLAKAHQHQGRKVSEVLAGDTERLCE